MDIGTTLQDRYTIIARVGKGAMGTVYRATDAQTGQTVAVKVLNRELALDHEMFERFRREGQALRQLRHPNIVGFVDSFEHDEQHIIVMEYVPGGNLHHLIKQGPLPVDRARRIALGLCDALTRAHDLNIVHRDIKPENVLLAEDGTPKLTDFGVARLLEAGTRLTGTGTQVGTPYYMAPEAWEGKPLDAQADVWALGVVLYEMLTGQVPFGGDTLIAVMNKVLNAPLADLRQVNPEAPPGLARVVAQMLTRDKARRYTSMRVVAADLEQSDTAVTGSALTRRAQPAHFPRWAWALMIGGGVIIALAVLALLWRGTYTATVEPTITLPAANTASSSLPGTVQPTRAANTTQAPPSATPGPAKPAAPAIPARPTSLTTLSSSSMNLEWQLLNDGKKFPAATVNTLAVDPKNPAHVLVGTYGAGIYSSFDGGTTWAPGNTGLGKGTVGSIAFHPQDPTIVYTALFDQGGVYKSIDGGQTWQTTNAGIDLSKAWNWTAVVAVDPVDPNRLYYTSAYNGFYLSMDGGASWTRRSVDCVHAVGLTIDPADGQHLYAASMGEALTQSTCPSGIYESTDAGMNWTRLTTDAVTGDKSAWWSLAADPRNFKTLYGASDIGTYTSADGGGSWTRIKPNGCFDLTVNPGDGAVYCLGSGSAQVSRDGGQTWLPLTVNIVRGGWERHPLAFSPSDPKTMYTGYDQVVRSTDNGQTWVSVGQLGLRRTQVKVDARDGTRLYLVTGELEQDASLYLSADGGRTWKSKLTDTNAGHLAVDGAQNVIYYASPWSKSGTGLYRSPDNGQTWESIGSGDLSKIGQVAPDPKDPAGLWALPECGARPLYSSDGGKTFSEVTSFPQPTCQPILLVDSAGQRLYIADWGGSWRSDDGGQTWKTGGALPGGYYRAAALDPSDPDIVYLGSTHRGVLRTTDGGETWQPANTGLTSPSVNEIVVDPYNPQMLYAATDGGAFVSLNRGEQWQLLPQGLGPNPIVYSIALDPNNPNRLYAATPDGLYSLAPNPPYNITVADHSAMWPVGEIGLGPGEVVTFHAESIDAAAVFRGQTVAFSGAQCNGAALQFVTYTVSFPADVVVTGIDIGYAGGSQPHVRLLDQAGQQLASTDSLRGGNQYTPAHLAVSNARGKEFQLYIDNDVRCWFELLHLAVEFRPVASAGATSSPADQARAFAEPILKAIANRAPDWSDDFSNPQSGWPAENVSPDNSYGYKDGAYVISAASANSSGGCTGAGPVSRPSFSDFVLEVEGRFVAGDTGDWMVIYRYQDPPGAHYGADVYPDGAFGFHKNVNNVHYPLTEPLISIPTFQPGGALNRLTLIAKGGQMAAYIDGEPVSRLDDTSSNEGTFSLGVCTKGDRLQVQFDNLKLWDLTKVPALQAAAFAEPILKAVAARPPDFADDFSVAATSRPNWKLVQATIQSGTLQLKANSGFAHASTSAHQAVDFVLELDFRPQADNQAGLELQFRQSATSFYDFNLSLAQGLWSIYSQRQETQVATFDSGRAGQVSAGQWQPLRLIARGDEFAVYLNDAPLTYFRDSANTDSSSNLTVDARSNLADLEIDNLKFWDLAKVPGLP